MGEIIRKLEKKLKVSKISSIILILVGIIIMGIGFTLLGEDLYGHPSGVNYFGYNLVGFNDIMTYDIVVTALGIPFIILGIIFGIMHINQRRRLDKLMSGETTKTHEESALTESKVIQVTPGNDKLKTRLFGMIKSMKKVDLAQAPAMIGMDRQSLQQLLFDLVGEGKIVGEFVDDDTFIIASSVESFLTELDLAFSSWGKQEKMKEGKLDFPLQ